MKHLPIKALIVCGTLVIISFCLTFIRIELPLDSIVHPLYLIPIIMIGYMYGGKYAVIAGILLGILDFIQNNSLSSPVQIIIVTVIPFATLGISGLFRSKRFGLILGYLLSIILLFAVSVISSLIIVSSAPIGMPPIRYALLHNTYTILVDGVISLIVLFIPTVQRLVDKTMSVTLEQ